MGDAFDRLVSRVLEPTTSVQPRAAQPFESAVEPRFAGDRSELHLKTEASPSQTSRQPVDEGHAHSSAFEVDPGPSPPPQPHPTISAPILAQAGDAPHRVDDQSGNESMRVLEASSPSITPTPVDPFATHDAESVLASVAPLSEPAPVRPSALRRVSSMPSSATRRMDQHRDSDPADPVIRITIGRLEVRADVAAPIAPATRPRPERRVMPLEEYLERRAEGTRP
jgi:hypothetical protein